MERSGTDERSGSEPRPALLCFSPSYAPETTPTAIRASKLLERLSARWDITLVTEATPQRNEDGVRIEVVAARRPRRLLAALRCVRLDKLLEMIVWPDESIFWVLPAIAAGRRLIAERRPSAIVVFMMPYSAGLAGIALSRMTGLPLVLNLDDSPTCTDMHPSFPTRLHYVLARRLEDLYARRADAVVYVSQTNLERVGSRQAEDVRTKLHLVRYGADPQDSGAVERGAGFEIAYVGAMSGWWRLIERASSPSLPRRIFAAWTRLGRHQRVALDEGTSSPAVIGRAINEALAEHPDWGGRVALTLHGNPYPRSVVERAIQAAGVEGVVAVRGPVAHSEVASILAHADLLFLTLPRRLDGSRGGRISAKTYEYLTTDRPILAAVPRGENWDYLADKPGVWLVEPSDSEGMRDVIVALASDKFAGHPGAFDRAGLHEELSYATRAEEFATVLLAAIERRRLSGAGSRRGRRRRSPR